MNGKKITLIKRNKKRYHSPKLKPLKVMNTYIYHDKIFRNNPCHTKVKTKLMRKSVKNKYNNRNEIIHSFRNRLYDVVWINGSSMLIRLEAINEDNFDCLMSTIERLDKDWEVTKIIGESFLKVFLKNH